MNKTEFLKETGITDRQFKGLDVIQGNVHLEYLKSIPRGFNPRIIGSLFLDNVEKLPENFSPIIKGNLVLNMMKKLPNKFSPVVSGSLGFNALEEINEGFKPIIGDSLVCNSVQTLPENFDLQVGGNMCFYNLKKLPTSFKPVVFNKLILTEVEEIPKSLFPKSFSPTASALYLGINSLNVLDLFHLQCPIYNFGSKISQKHLEQNITLFWQGTKYAMLDYCFVEVLSKEGDYYKVKELNETEDFFIIVDEKIQLSARGGSKEKAKENLLYAYSALRKNGLR